ncbi:MAG: HlyC/CorC family transporter [Planctomycetes bacterium]|nr:HlyC/CorC family transporter [Planctomycetota bacterium]
MGLSFFFSGSETALFTLTREDLHRFKEEKGRSGRIIHSLLDSPKDLLVTILFGNMVVNIFFYSLSYGLIAQIENALAQTAVGVVSLILVVLFGEVVPKSVAVAVPCRFARVIAFPIAAFKKISFPVRYALGRVIDAFAQVARHGAAEEKYITADELKMLVDVSQQTGVLDRAERTMINEIVELGEVRVKEVMTPRVDMALFDLAGDPQNLRALIRETRHTKIPVYRGDIDNIVGVIHSKDVFLKPDEDLESLVRPIRFVPESKTIESLLRQFRAEKTQMAIVVDEYGGAEGMVTLEDILEEIVGEIEDEYDEAEPPVQVIENSAYLLSGDLNLRDWEDLFGDEIIRPGVTTLGGFVTGLLGHLPKEGEQVQYKNLFFTIKKQRHHRVAQVLLELMPEEKTEEEKE